MNPMDEFMWFCVACWSIMGDLSHYRNFVISFTFYMLTQLSLLVIWNRHEISIKCYSFDLLFYAKIGSHFRLNRNNVCFEFSGMEKINLSGSMPNNSTPPFAVRLTVIRFESLRFHDEKPNNSTQTVSQTENDKQPDCVSFRIRYVLYRSLRRLIILFISFAHKTTAHECRKNGRRNNYNLPFVLFVPTNSLCGDGLSVEN